MGYFIYITNGYNNIQCILLMQIQVMWWVEMESYLKTSNAGSTWDTLSSGTLWDLYSIYFTDVNTGYAVGKKDTSLKTVNAGTTLDSIIKWHHMIYIQFTLPDTI